MKKISYLICIIYPTTRNSNFKISVVNTVYSII